MHDVWIALVTAVAVLAGAAIGAAAVLKASRDERSERQREALDAAITAYLSALYKAYAMLARLPQLDPRHPFHRLSDLQRRASDSLLGPSVSFLQTERGMRRYLGEHPFAAGEAIVDAAARLQVLDTTATLDAAIEVANDYLILLAADRSEETLSRWPAVRRALLDAIEDSRRTSSGRGSR